MISCNRKRLCQIPHAEVFIPVSSVPTTFLWAILTSDTRLSTRPLLKMNIKWLFLYSVYDHGLHDDHGLPIESRAWPYMGLRAPTQWRVRTSHGMHACARAYVLSRRMHARHCVGTRRQKDGDLSRRSLLPYIDSY